MKRAQNIIEFVLLFPLTIFIVLIIFELAMMWHSMNTAEMINREINSNLNVDYNTYAHLQNGDTCPAITDLMRNNSILANKTKVLLRRNDITFNSRLQTNQNEPFGVYQISSNEGGENPFIRYIVDCRNPYDNGIETKLIYRYSAMFFSFLLPRFDSSERIVVIGNNENEASKGFVMLSTSEVRTNAIGH